MLLPCEHTIANFLALLGHPVALVGLKPVDVALAFACVWPAEQTDVVDQAAWLGRQYHAVYVNLNPLHPEMMSALPEAGRSVSDTMIARRTRVLINIDGHDVPKEVAREQMEAIKAQIGEPLMATDSGNGYGLIYTCDLPNDEESKRRVQIYLQQLKAEFPCVDTSVYGAGRLTRLIGTLNRSVIDGSRITTSLLREPHDRPDLGTCCHSNPAASCLR